MLSLKHHSHRHALLKQPMSFHVRMSRQTKTHAYHNNDTDLKKQVRVLEVSSGRSAFMGLMVGNVSSLISHKTFLQQAHENSMFVAALVVMFIAITYKQFDGRVEKEKVKYELNAYRISMCFMAIIALMETVSS